MLWARWRRKQQQMHLLLSLGWQLPLTKQQPPLKLTLPHRQQQMQPPLLVALLLVQQQEQVVMVAGMVVKVLALAAITPKAGKSLCAACLSMRRCPDPMTVMPRSRPASM